jgi:tetratricopeptide (TPR) repeat protein
MQLMIRLPTSGLVASLLVATMATAPARAAEPTPQAGFVMIRVTPCMLAKSGEGPRCELPTLPENAGTQQMIAAHVNRAQFFINVGELQNALNESDAALALDPKNVDIRHLVARLAMSTGDFARAEREIKTSIEQRPDDVDLRATDAVRLKARARLEEALHEFDDILARRPDHSFSREERATLLMSLVARFNQFERI